MTDPHAHLAALFREHHGLLLADLAKRARGDLERAEEALSQAFAAALDRWPERGQPADPVAWLASVARTRLADSHRQRTRENDHHRTWLESRPPVHDPEPLENAVDEPIPDERLSLLFTSCHPALDTSAQVALLLSCLGGLTVPEIARAFLVAEPTLAQRLVRAKRKIRQAGIPFRTPAEPELPERLGVVLEALYLIFNEGFAATSGTELLRESLCTEALALSRLVAQLLPSEPEAAGLTCLLRLHHARRLARTSPEGDLVLLADQDRSLWDRAEIAAAAGDLEQTLRQRRPGPFQIQAAIAALHAEAGSAEATDWPQILALYDELLRHHPTPVTELNRAVALCEVEGPEAARATVESLADSGQLRGYLYLHTTLAELRRRTGDLPAARSAYLSALELAGSAPERRFLTRRLAELDDPAGSAEGK